MGHKRRQFRGGYRFAGLLELVRELREKQTLSEALLWELLRKRQLLGFIFRRQHQFGDYIADLYCGTALPQKSAKPTNENSPPIHRWDRDDTEHAVRETDG